MTAIATGVVSASILALTIGGAQQVAAAPFSVLSTKAVSAESPIIQARYKARKRTARRSRSVRRARSARRARGSRRAVRSRYRGRRGNAAAVAMIGAFGAIVASAIAADARRDRYVTYSPGYYQPHYGYAPVYRHPHVYHGQRYYQPHRVNRGGHYVNRKRRGIGRVFGQPRRVFAPRRGAPAFRGRRAASPRIARRS